MVDGPPTKLKNKVPTWARWWSLPLWGPATRGCYSSNVCKHGDLRKEIQEYHGKSNAKFIEIQTKGRGWRFLGGQLKFIVFQFEKCHCSLCFTVFCVLPMTWEYQELVPHADNISGISCPLFQCCLVFFKFINLDHFCFSHWNCVSLGISGFFW